MKTKHIVYVMLALLCVFMFVIVQAKNYSSVANWDHASDSTGTGLTTTTDSLTGGTTGFPWFYFQNLDITNSGTIDGMLRVGIVDYDSTVNGNYPDTTTDTVTATLYTSFDSRAGETALLSLEFVSMPTDLGGTVTYETQTFSVPADSVVGRFAYWRFVTESNALILDDTVTSYYEAVVQMIAR